LVVAAAAAGQQDLQAQVVDVMRQAAMGQLEHIDMAWVSLALSALCLSCLTSGYLVCSELSVDSAPTAH
jgi:hypothetical protein